MVVLPFHTVTAIQPPIVEELLFRGLVFSLLLMAFSDTWAMIISSLLFGILHIMLSPINAIVSALIGVMYCLVVKRTGSTVPAMALHYIQSTSLYWFGIGIALVGIYELFSLLTPKRKRGT